MLDIVFDGEIERLDSRTATWRARVEKLGIHAYGTTNDEARTRAERLVGMTLDVWEDFNILERELSRCEVHFWRSQENPILDEDRAFQADLKFAYA